MATNLSFSSIGEVLRYVIRERGLTIDQTLARMGETGGPTHPGIKSKAQFTRYLGNTPVPAETVILFEQALGLPPGRVFSLRTGTPSQDLPAPVPESVPVPPIPDEMWRPELAGVMRLEHRENLRQRLRLPYPEPLLPYLDAFSREFHTVPRVAELAATWIGAALTLVEEGRDISDLADEWRESFHPIEALAPREAADVGILLLQALRHLSKNSPSLREEWTRGEGG